jgi:hypothetical protein
MDARGIPRELSMVLAQLCEVFPRIEELEGGKPASAALPDGPHRLGTRRSKLHHKAAGRDDNEAPHGGFGGPQHTQHGAVEGCGIRETVAWPASPSMAKSSATIPFSASLLRLMAKSQSMMVPYPAYRTKQEHMNPIAIDCQGFFWWFLSFPRNVFTLVYLIKVTSSYESRTRLESYQSN